MTSSSSALILYSRLPIVGVQATALPGLVHDVDMRGIGVVIS